MPSGSWRDSSKELAHIPDLRGERGGVLVSEEPAELLQVGPAARGVDDDEVDVVEDVDEPTRKRLPLLESACVNGQRPAAPLRRRGYFESVCCEDARGRGVHVREDGTLHTPGEQANACTPDPHRRGDSRHVAFATPPWCDLDEGSEPSRHRRDPAKRRHAERGSHATWIGQDAEQEPTDEAIGERTLVLLLDGRSGALDEPVVANT